MCPNMCTYASNYALANTIPLSMVVFSNKCASKTCNEFHTSPPLLSPCMHVHLTTGPLGSYLQPLRGHQVITLAQTHQHKKG